MQFPVWHSRILFIRFFIASVINYHPFSGLKQYPFIILQFSKSEVQNQFLQVKIEVLGELHSSGGPRGESFSLPLPAPTGCLHSLAHGTSLHLQVSSSTFTLPWPPLLSSHLLWLWSSFFLLRASCFTGPTLITQDNLPTPRSLAEWYVESPCCDVQ